MLSFIAVLILIVGLILKKKNPKILKMLKSKLIVVVPITSVYILLLICIGQFLGFPLSDNSNDDNIEKQIQNLNVENMKIETKMADGIDIRKPENEELINEYFENIEKIEDLEHDKVVFHRLKWLLYFGK